ncbi:MAG: hypothetical protein RR623_00700 [Bacilli bacterium]
MNLGWYETMDRIAMIQDQLEMNVAKHQEIDKEFYDLVQEAQEKLSKAYQYAGKKFNDSCGDFSDV